MEACAILEGLFLAWDKGYKVEVECDNALLVELLRSGGAMSNNLVEVRLIHQVFRRNWEVYLCHVPRKINEVADAMAKQTNSDDL